ncbi:predicted protein [Pyrenophora tritici-repentis Pt-1C-BFP]|uniref:Uncharacterized protein n=1 Tax=Pyrenophora tritici-repentis (strain Pt-1C-BFP) TaxID=426418 RepID=B2W306_PYRTR|nr:uncharacterized protein PTRG_03804 [Pyrenophora tritici-repentis Pt-1C-BFP]EDU46642.1 predicted protein [Pyrenophora tritici-repentis Pt-1C-BFP]
MTTEYSTTATDFSAPTDAAFTAVQNILVPEIRSRPRIEGLEIDSQDHTFCHPHSLEYLYYTITYPNGTLARNLEGRHALFYTPSPWPITYFDHFAEAILNDTPTTTTGCTGAHCFNRYSGPVRSGDVSESRVALAEIGYFIRGANLPPPVLEYMEKEIGRRFLWGKVFWRLCLLLVWIWV